ncbi:hypothetical protein Tco_0266376 [Tanacetum coccineum]
MGCVETIEEMLEIKVVKMGGNEEVFSSDTWRRAFDINDPIYTKLCHEFFSTFEFDEEVNDEELTSKKIIKISSEDQLRLSRSATQTIRSPIMRVLQKMITCGLCQRTIGYDKIQRNELWLTSMFEDGNKERAPIYYRTLDATTLRELISPDGRLIAEDPTLGVLRYFGVFEYMVAHYEVPLDGAYAPPVYDEEQQHQ